MRFPKPMAKLNERFAQIAGLLVLFIGILSVIEVFARSIFNAPTTWTADLESYLLVYAIFLTGGYCFQVHGHIKVDILIHRFNEKGQRIFAFISTGVVVFFMILFTRSTLNIMQSYINTGAMTYAFFQIPKWVPLMGVFIGCILMLLTILFIILDLCTKSTEYLE